MHSHRSALTLSGCRCGSSNTTSKMRENRFFLPLTNGRSGCRRLTEVDHVGANGRAVAIDCWCTQSSNNLVLITFQDIVKSSSKRLKIAKTLSLMRTEISNRIYASCTFIYCMFFEAKASHSMFFSFMQITLTQKVFLICPRRRTHAMFWTQLELFILLVKCACTIALCGRNRASHISSECTGMEFVGAVEATHASSTIWLGVD